VTASAAARGRKAASPSASDLLLAVVAAHRTGQPLHPQLVALGGRFVRSAVTAPLYRLLALPGGDVERGGILRVGTGGAAIDVELHQLPGTSVTALLAVLPEPLAIGRVQLADGASVQGLVCAYRPDGAVDVSRHGSWPAYLASVAAAG
jgi:hypothetical protein